MMTNKTLLNDIERFIEKFGMSPSGFGRLFLNNPNFVSDLQKGEDTFSPKMKTVNKLKVLMKNYKPKKG